MSFNNPLLEQIPDYIDIDESIKYHPKQVEIFEKIISYIADDKNVIEPGHDEYSNDASDSDEDIEVEEFVRVLNRSENIKEKEEEKQEFLACLRKIKSDCKTLTTPQLYHQNETNVTRESLDKINTLLDDNFDTRDHFKRAFSTQRISSFHNFDKQLLLTKRQFLSQCTLDEESSKKFSSMRLTQLKSKKRRFSKYDSKDMAKFKGKHKGKSEHFIIPVLGLPETIESSNCRYQTTTLVSSTHLLSKYSNSGNLVISPLSLDSNSIDLDRIQIIKNRAPYNAITIHFPELMTFHNDDSIQIFTFNPNISDCIVDQYQQEEKTLFKVHVILFNQNIIVGVGYRRLLLWVRDSLLKEPPTEISLEKTGVSTLSSISDTRSCLMDDASSLSGRNRILIVNKNLGGDLFQIWDLNDGKLLQNYPNNTSESCLSFGYSNDTVVASFGNSITILKVGLGTPQPTVQRIVTFKTNQIITSLSVDKHFILVGMFELNLDWFCNNGHDTFESFFGYLYNNIFITLPPSLGTCTGLIHMLDTNGNLLSRISFCSKESQEDSEESLLNNLSTGIDELMETRIVQMERIGKWIIASTPTRLLVYDLFGAENQPPFDEFHFDNPNFSVKQFKIFDSRVYAQFSPKPQQPGGADYQAYTPTLVVWCPKTPNLSHFSQNPQPMSISDLIEYSSKTALFAIADQEQLIKTNLDFFRNVLRDIPKAHQFIEKLEKEIDFKPPFIFYRNLLYSMDKFSSLQKKCDEGVSKRKNTIFKIFDKLQEDMNMFVTMGSIIESIYSVIEATNTQIINLKTQIRTLTKPKSPILTGRQQFRRQRHNSIAF